MGPSRSARAAEDVAPPDPQWEDFAAREPYFAVITAPQFLRANLTPEHERAFFAGGENLVSWMFDVIDAGLSHEFAPIATLEYGCGVGRLAIPLARRPGSITAVDRSPVMLDHARREAARRGLGHIVFQTPAELLAAPRRFDLVVCYHVLQRLPRRDAIALVERLLALVSPDGVGVVQWPIGSGASRVTAASRWLRERVPGANTLANALLGKRAGDPFVPTRTFSLAEMLPAFDAAGFRSRHVVFEEQEGLDYAIVLATRSKRIAKPSRAAAGPRDEGRAAAAAPAVSDAEIDASNQAAEAYFAALAGWEHHLAKPFGQAAETPAILMNAAVVLQALDLAPGLTVLEFGAGTGWLSRFLTQLGCRLVLLDVSPTALRIARELYRRQPVIGDRPAPEFLEYDGRRIALPDASVDRIVCFDAFHHAPDPDATIREFGRLLRPGGVAAFSEPGPRHSESPRSRFETRTYGVVEKDVDVHAVWRTARACGFADLRMCVFHTPPYHVSLAEYEDLAAGGAAQDRWLAATRTFLHRVRAFFLVKAGRARADSRATAGLACEIQASIAAPAIEGRPIAIDAAVTNTGTASWLAPDAAHGGVLLGAHLYDSSGALVTFDFHAERLTDTPREIAPGETVRCRVTVPPLTAGTHRIELDCVAAQVTWFALVGSRPLMLVVDVTQT